MKRLACLFCALFFFAASQSFANYTEFQPTPFSKSNTQDRVWTGASQMAWNDFKSKVVFDNVRFAQGTPTSVQDLNMFLYSQEYIPDSCYYKAITKNTKSSQKKIIKDIKKKYLETAPILENVELTNRNDRILIYTMFKKDCAFTTPFEELGYGNFGDEQKVLYYGVNKNTKYNYRNDIDVLFYNSQNDFAIRLKTNGDSFVYLYKTPSNKPFNQLYYEITQKEKIYYGDKKFSEIDELKVPYIVLNRDYNLEELSEKRIKGTNLILDNALASIRFTMNNPGEMPKPDDGIKSMQKALNLESKARLFYFDDSFVLFLQAKNQHVPYFGLRINDMTNYQNYPEG